MPELAIAESPVPQRSRRVVILIAVVLLLTILASGTAAFVVYGEHVYYRRWNSVRTWSNTDSLDAQRNVRWFSVIDRKASRNIKMETHNEFALGMVLVFELHPDGSGRGYTNARARDSYRVTRTIDGRETEYLVQLDRITVAGELYPAKQGRLVWVGLDGAVTQHQFETDAQNSKAMQEAIEAFAAARK